MRCENDRGGATLPQKKDFYIFVRCEHDRYGAPHVRNYQKSVPSYFYYIKSLHMDFSEVSP
jgi:hypothetical protein